MHIFVAVQLTRNGDFSRKSITGPSSSTGRQSHFLYKMIVLYIASTPWCQWWITFLWKGGSAIAVIDGRRYAHWEIAIKKAIIQINFISPSPLGMCGMYSKLFRESNPIHIINRIQITHIERNGFFSSSLTSLAFREIKLLIFQVATENVF